MHISNFAFLCVSQLEEADRASKSDHLLTTAWGLPYKCCWNCNRWFYYSNFSSTNKRQSPSLVYTTANMLNPTFILALMSCISLSAASPCELAPRCGTTVYPTILQQLSESQPSTIYPNTLRTDSTFNVSHTVGPDGKTTNRIYQIVGFQNIPSTAYTCQLNVKFDPGYPITSVGSPVLNVTTLYKDAPASIAFPNDYSWG